MIVGFVLTFESVSMSSVAAPSSAEDADRTVSPKVESSVSSTTSKMSEASAANSSASVENLTKQNGTAGSAKTTNIYDESDLEETSPPEKVKKHWFWLKHGPSFLKLRYYFAAQNASDCEFFYGLIQDNPFLGRASVDFNSADGCKCHGVGQVTHVPLKGNGAGQRGYIHVKCEDGRHMNGHFTTTSVTTGFADLTDDRGHKFEATFGHSADQAIDKVNALRKRLGCPEVTAQEVETKVNAEILNKRKR
jgi:hypothetical protein